MSESDIEEVEVITTTKTKEIEEEKSSGHRHRQERYQQGESSHVEVITSKTKETDDESSSGHHHQKHQHQQQQQYAAHQYVEPPIQEPPPPQQVHFASSTTAPSHYNTSAPPPQNVHIQTAAAAPVTTTTTATPRRQKQQYNEEGGRRASSAGVNVNYKTIAIVLAIISFLFNIVAIGVKSYVSFNALDVFRIVTHILIINGLCLGYFCPPSSPSSHLSQWIYLHICVTEIIIFILSIVLFGIYLGAGIRFSDHSNLLSDAVFYQIDQLRNSGFYFAAAGLTFMDGIIIAFLTVICFLIFKSYK